MLYSRENLNIKALNVLLMTEPPPPDCFHHGNELAVIQLINC